MRSFFASSRVSAFSTLARRGVYIIENLALEGLAALGHHEFEFVCLPLKLVGATGSPVRPVARVG